MKYGRKGKKKGKEGACKGKKLVGRIEGVRKEVGHEEGKDEVGKLKIWRKMIKARN